MRFKIGDKVCIPLTKSIGTRLEDSSVVNKAKENKQPFLYVAIVHNNSYSLRCSLNNYGGGLFKEKDLVPFSLEEFYIAGITGR